jgi:flagellar motility protein MotE (MotC chaperone)
MKILQSSWVTLILGGVLYLAVTGFLLRPSHLASLGIQARATEEAPSAPSVSWEYTNPEVDLLVTELKKEKALVQQRQDELNELAARLEAERAEITIVTQTVARLQKEFDQNVVRVQEQEVANIKKLAKTYATMDASGATTIFKQMDDEQIVKIMMYMKESETAPILEGLARMSETEAKRTAGISDRLRTAIVPKTPTKP